MNSAEAKVTFAGETFLLHADGTLYWPREKTLIASDLHFEKASFLASHGALVPPYDTLDTLLRLQSRIDQYQPQRLLLLGDSFHDVNAWERMDASLRLTLLALNAAVPEVIWLEGNHDRNLSENPLGWFTKELQLGPILFSHEPVETPLPLVIGHYHPKTQARIARQTIRGRCLIHAQHLMIMPAYGSFTGGLTIQDPAIAGLFPQQTCPVYLLYKTHVVPLQVAFA